MPDNYPINATWEAELDGVIANVWKVAENFWRYRVRCGDGSGVASDWYMSRRPAVEAAKCRMAGMTDERPIPRFKRVKEGS